MSKGIRVIKADNDLYKSLTIVAPNDDPMSWELLQAIKDKFHPELDFIEVYPKKSQVINKSNVRHLFHIKDWTCPKLKDLEVESDIQLVTYKEEI